MLGNDETKQIPGGDPKNALLGVQLDVIGLEVGEGFLWVYDQLCGSPGLHDDVIDVYFKIPADLLVETMLHAAMESRPSVL